MVYFHLDMWLHFKPVLVHRCPPSRNKHSGKYKGAGCKIMQSNCEVQLVNLFILCGLLLRSSTKPFMH